MNNIQKKKPIRTCTKVYKDYKLFKPFIRKDFNERCGYCDDIDSSHGGSGGYHIDHFKPHSIVKFKHLKQEYSNLVYSCPFCNRAKSNKWENVEGFVDPCDNKYNLHMSRNNKGKIISQTPQGQYIYKNLNLYLKRHELLWMIEKISEQKEELKLFKKKLGNNHYKYINILEEFMQCDENLKQYMNLLQ